MGPGKIGPGTVVHLCGIISSPLVFRGSGTLGNPITLRFERDAKLSAPTWPTAGLSGIIHVSSKDYVVIDGGENGVIEATDDGTAKTHQHHIRGVRFENAGYSEVKNLTIRNLYVRTPYSSDYRQNGTGISIDGVNSVKVYNNTISECRTGISAAYRHNGNSLEIYGNNIARVSNGVFIGGANTGHTLTNLSIHNNVLGDQYNWEGTWDPRIGGGDGHFHNDGIQISAPHGGNYVQGVKVYENIIGGDMGKYMTAFIYMEDDIRNTEVYNNILFTTGAGYPVNGFIVAGSSGYIYNNTVVTSNGGGAAGLSGSGSKIIGNIFYNVSTGIATDFANRVGVSDYNIYVFKKEPAEMYMRPYIVKYDQWRATYGYDAHSLRIDPQFVNLSGKDFRLRSGSPAIDAIADASLLAELRNIITKDKNGISRPQGSGWDIGAYESSGNGNVVPALPPPCTSFAYSAWGTCANGMQTRTITTTIPASCLGGSPVTIQSCTAIVNLPVLPPIVPPPVTVPSVDVIPRTIPVTPPVVPITPPPTPVIPTPTPTFISRFIPPFTSTNPTTPSTVTKPRTTTGPFVPLPEVTPEEAISTTKVPFTEQIKSIFSYILQRIQNGFMRVFGM